MRLNILIFLAVTTITLAGCKDDEATPDTNPIEVPSTYNFENVNIGGQQQRLAQFKEMNNYMSGAREDGFTLDNARLQAMFMNDSNIAQWAGTYDASKQLKSKTFETHQQVFVQLLDSIAASSASTVLGTNGTAGRVKSKDGSKTFLLNANGVDEAQLIQKGIMGACFLYQIDAVYTGVDKMNVDNTTVTPGEGTAMEHHWDEAFGYYGVPVDFPANTDNLAFWGSYSNSRNSALGTNDLLMNAFLKGRAGISGGDLTMRDEAIATIRSGFDKIAAGSAIHYFNTAMEKADDIAVRSHVLSEATGFIFCLYFNPDSKITKDQIDQWLVKLGGSSDLTKVNLYSTTDQDLAELRDAVAAAFGLQSDL